MKKLLIGLLVLGSLSALADSANFCSIKYNKVNYKFGFKAIELNQSEINLKSTSMTDVTIIKDSEGDVLEVFIPQEERGYIGNVSARFFNMDHKHAFVKSLTIKHIEESQIVKSLIKSFYGRKILSLKVNETELEFEINEGQSFRVSVPLSKGVSLFCKDNSFI